MRRFLPLVVATAFFAIPSRADVSVTFTVAKSCAGMITNTKRVMYFKDAKLRIDDFAGTAVSTRILDLRSGTAIIIDHEHHAAATSKLGEYGRVTAQRSAASRITVAMRPSGEAREILGKTCNGYDLVVSSSDIRANARYWDNGDAPGSSEYHAFWKASKGRCLPVEGWSSNPIATSQNAVISEIFRRMAESGGIPNECEMRFELSERSPAASHPNGVVDALTFRIVDISTSSIADGVFAVPSGYTNESK